MSVLKGLERSDVYLTDYISKKQWCISGSNLGDLDIKFIRAVSGSLPYFWNPADEIPYGNISGSVADSYKTTHCLDCDYKKKGVYETCSRCGSDHIEILEDVYNSRLVYESLKALYYSGSLGDGTFEGYTDLNLQTTLTIPGARNLQTRVYKDHRDTEDLPDEEQNWENPGITVITFPRDVIGSQISPGSLKIGVGSSQQCYVEDDYVDTYGATVNALDCHIGDDSYYTNPELRWVDPYFENLHTGDVTDYEGVLIYSGFVGTWSLKEGMKYPSPDRLENIVIGDIIYTQGILVITQEYLKYLFDRWDAETYQWQSEKPIFTEHVTCKVRDVDFNYTFNPTADQDTQFGEHTFTPYITTVGLYNNIGDLIAVAKLSKPIKKADNIDMTFDIQIDLG